MVQRRASRIVEAAVHRKPHCPNAGSHGGDRARGRQPTNGSMTSGVSHSSRSSVRLTPGLLWCVHRRLHTAQSILRIWTRRRHAQYAQYVRSMAAPGAIARVMLGLPIESRTSPESFSEREPRLRVISFAIFPPNRCRQRLTTRPRIGPVSPDNMTRRRAAKTRRSFPPSGPWHKRRLCHGQEVRPRRPFRGVKRAWKRGT